MGKAGFDGRDAFGYGNGGKEGFGIKRIHFRSVGKGGVFHFLNKLGRVFTNVGGFLDDRGEDLAEVRGEVNLRGVNVGDNDSGRVVFSRFMGLNSYRGGGGCGS